MKKINLIMLLALTIFTFSVAAQTKPAASSATHAGITKSVTHKASAKKHPKKHKKHPAKKKH